MKHFLGGLERFWGDAGESLCRILVNKCLVLCFSDMLHYFSIQIEN